VSDYPAFGKIARLHREVVLTEKIDGTNGLIAIEPAPMSYAPDFHRVRAGSRNRWLTPAKGDDNHGFAQWVEENEETLVADLGPGLHYGEWWGKGIGKRYSDAVDDKYFSLFNVSRWADKDFATPNVRVVPELLRGQASDLNSMVEKTLAYLRDFGSYAAPGCMKPEGVIVFHTASNGLFKVTLEKDEEYKGPNRT